ncbi:hypothetical protein L6164_002763 [Bauhinia variegata]|uniref:Uncharacterized protein n=1 Tax=Bauhinia variegata TaxID=167791 RepID=A0ACB9Q4Q8_BAUVA|nr:hypothetical protein L6164_002763 [Bauhinia variegata]
MAGMLHSLDSLVVEDSKLVEVVFDMGNIPPTNAEKDTCLRNIEIYSLSNLKHVWNRGKLQHLKVSFCNNLNNLYPFSIARDLQQHESLDTAFCEGIKEIVDRGNGSNT